MDIALLTRKFEEIGARVNVGPVLTRWNQVPQPMALDVRRDDRGEYFDLRIDYKRVERLEAVDVRPRERHLLLLAASRPFAGEPVVRRVGRWRQELVIPPLAKNLEKPRFLCGHDERHWFVAAVPESAHASNVRTAMEALKPAQVIASQARAGIRFEDRFVRKNRAFIRQGEWFFLPRADLNVPANLILRNEPLQRSGGKAHWAEFAFRQGGETVYVSDAFPSGLTEKAYREHLTRHPNNRARFRIMRRNATMFVRGRISHPDHATVMLNLWHEVLMNTENHAKARQSVVFLD